MHRKRRFTLKSRVTPWLLASTAMLLAGPVFAKDTVTYYLTDSLHSVVVELDAQRNVLSTTHYGPYGLVLDRSLRDGPGYSGHEEDPATGLNYMQQRYYDPQAGRFVSTDPVLPTEDGGHFNRYWYANDNPYRYTDPDGRTCKKAASDGSYNCTVDDNAGNWNQSLVKTADSAYTRAVNRLLNDPNRTAKITVDGKTFTVSAKAVAKALIGTWVVTGNGHPKSRADTLGGTLTPNRGHNGHPKTTLYPNVMSSDRSGGTAFIDDDLSRTFVHEGIHDTTAESVMIPLYRNDPDGFNTDHQQSYNAASDWLYDPIPILPPVQLP